MSVAAGPSERDADGGGSRGGGGTKLGRRLGAALSRVDFERCDPSTCVSVLHVATIQVLTRPCCIRIRFHSEL